MRRRYVVAIDELSSAQRQQFLSYVKEAGFGWWHWIGDFWLLTKTGEPISAADLRDKILEISPGKRCIVMEVKEAGRWAGFGPSGASKNMFNWIRETWLKKDDAESGPNG